jgi:hypothetical protein
MKVLLRVLPLAAIAFSFSCSDNNGDMPPDTCTNITGSVTEDGLSIRRPEEDAAGCIETVSTTPGAPPLVCEKKEPDLSCKGMVEPLGTSHRVTFTGCVTSFGLSAQSDALTVTAFYEINPSGGQPTDPGYDLFGVPGMQDEKTQSAFIAKTVSRLVDASECPDLGAFTLENVPTETPMIIRVTDQQFAAEERRYVDTYQYNMVLRNSAIRTGASVSSPLVTDPATTCMAAGSCFVNDEVNTIFTTTFRSIPPAAGVSFIPGADDLYDGTGEGHLAGEVQDCTSTDKVQNAVVALDLMPRKVAYFNVGFPPDPDDLDDPKVEGTRTRTNGDGLYAAIGIGVTEGGQAVKVGAAVTASVCGPDGICKCEGSAANPAYTAADEGEGESTILATRTVYVYPDSITIMTFDRNLYTTP